MLRSVTHLQGFTLRATDGEIGKIDHFYFDDESWAIRYLVVNAGSWLEGRQVLISPIAVGQTHWESKQLDVKLTKKQVEDSPNIDMHKPVSRQHESEYLGYYGYPFYWEGPYLWGSITDPAGMAIQRSIVKKASSTKVEKGPADSHLRSTKEVTSYHIEATDGEIGHVENFIIDNHTWAIQYLEVTTRNWLPGKKVLISPYWIDRVSWAESKVYVDLSRESIKNGPEYSESMSVSREYEHKLWDHYQRSAYWLREVEKPQSRAAGK
jgi:hypothetical protein